MSLLAIDLKKPIVGQPMTKFNLLTSRGREFMKQDKEGQEDKVPKNAVTFLIAEYSELNTEFRRLRGEGLNRLNFYIAITSSVLGGLVLLRQSGNTPGVFLQIVSLVAVFFLVLIGWDTFKYAIARDINTDNNLRRISRIRRFFVNEYPPVERYLPWQSHDEPTSWVAKNTSGIRQTAQLMISLLIGLMIIILTSFVSLEPIVFGISGVIAFIAAFVLLRFYANRRYKSAHLTAIKDMKFPNRAE
jgi:hypothetical protein